jgi:hypothetical protein
LLFFQFSHLLFFLQNSIHPFPPTDCVFQKIKKGAPPTAI